jgi:hypothetical protein
MIITSIFGLHVLGNLILVGFIAFYLFKRTFERLSCEYEFLAEENMNCQESNCVTTTEALFTDLP